MCEYDNDVSGYDTQDLQADLAGMVLSNLFPDLQEEYRTELLRRGESVPVHVRYEYGPCYRFGRRVVYDLTPIGEEHATETDLSQEVSLSPNPVVSRRDDL